AGVVGETAPATPEREGRSHDHGEAQLRPHREGVVDRPCDPGPRDVEAGLRHDALEAASILRPMDRLERRAEHADPEPVEVTGLRERDADVEAGLTAERGEQRIGPLALQDLQDRSWRERLDVGAVGEAGVGHDRGRVRVHERNLEALPPEHRAGLRARVVELARLADHDGTGPDHHDRAQVGASRHQTPPSIIERKASKRYRESCGPGAASGWYWTLAAGTSRHRNPSSVPSFRFRWVNATAPNAVGATGGVRSSRPRVARGGP